MSPKLPRKKKVFSTDEPHILADVVVTSARRRNTAAAFGTRQDTGETVFIPPSVTRAMNPQIGDILHATLVPSPATGMSSQWFLTSAVPAVAGDEGEMPALIGLVHSRLAEGGVWTPDRLAAELPYDMPFDARVAIARAAADDLCAKGACSKFILFENGSRSASGFWFTCFPRDADVDEFEEDRT